MIFGNERFAVLVVLHCKRGQVLAFAIFKLRTLELLLRFLHYTSCSVVFRKCLLPQKTTLLQINITKARFSALEEMPFGFTWQRWWSFFALNFECSAYASLVPKRPKSPAQKGITYVIKLPQIVMLLFKESLVFYTYQALHWTTVALGAYSAEWDFQSIEEHSTYYSLLQRIVERKLWHPKILLQSIRIQLILYTCHLLSHLHPTNV